MLRFFCIEIFCDVPTWLSVNFLEEKYQEKWENAYLTVKSATASEAPAYRVMYLQAKPTKQLNPLLISDKENGNCICQNGAESFILKDIL